jgi:hypothetical protein
MAKSAGLAHKILDDDRGPAGARMHEWNYMQYPHGETPAAQNSDTKTIV